MILCTLCVRNNNSCVAKRGAGSRTRWGPPTSRSRSRDSPREGCAGPMEPEQTTPPSAASAAPKWRPEGTMRAAARLLLARPDRRLPTYFRRQRRPSSMDAAWRCSTVALFPHAAGCRCALDAGRFRILYSLLARDHFVPRALAASVDSWEEFSANELLRRQRRFRAVAHLRGRRKRSAFATWALAASLASFDRESRRVLRRRLLADAFATLRTVRTGPCTPRSASRMAAYSTV